jgi:hypothetical protein
MGVATPPFNPSFGTGAPGVGAPINQLYYDTSTVPYTGYVHVSGAWHAFTGGGGSTGANPSATAGPAAINGVAATFMRSDAAPAIQLGTASVPGLVQADGITINVSGGVISAVAGGGGYPAGTIPSVVQTAFSVAGGNSATFGSAPTNGNLLVAIIFNPTGDTAGAGWTLQIANSTGTDYGAILTKIAGVGESLTQSPLTGIGGTGAIVIWELHSASTPRFIDGLSQPETSSSTSNIPVTLPNIKNCIGLSAIGVVTTPTITAAFNVGVQDVLDNTNARRLIAGHTDLSQTPMVGIFLTLSASGQSKGCTCVISS